MAGHFTAMDYIVFLGTIAISILIGVYYAFIKKQKTNADLLVGKENDFNLILRYDKALYIFNSRLYSKLYRLEFVIYLLLFVTVMP